MPMQAMQGMPMQAMQPMQPSRQAGAPGTAASGMDESLSQIQAALAQMGGGAANVYASAEQGAYTVEQLRTWLRSNGQQTTARVDKLEDSGKLVGDERIYTIGMTLNIPGGDPQKLPESAAMVPLSVSHKLFQGMTVPVRYAAENPNLLMVEWDKV
jgi:hypothetical protein